MLKLSSHPLMLVCRTAHESYMMLISVGTWTNPDLRNISPKMAEVVFGFLVILELDTGGY